MKSFLRNSIAALNIFAVIPFLQIQVLPTVTPTVEPTASPSPTGSASPTPSSTPTTTPSATPSVTPEASPTPVATPSSAATPTNTPLISGEDEQKERPSPSPSSTPSPTVVPSPRPTGTPFVVFSLTDSNNTGGGSDIAQTAYKTIEPLIRPFGENIYYSDEAKLGQKESQYLVIASSLAILIGLFMIRREIRRFVRNSYIDYIRFKNRLVETTTLDKISHATN